ncbi:restriction endonuclease [Bacillus toyonensis]|uniref:restriction endonuclease n=1 Tax=Bacillus toyonensis TaxID=155322 RepID=UPI0015D523C4|nr:restriction endonuclease [Bacillus toyonensis]
MKNAWIVRPFPHGINRMKEFLTKYEQQTAGNGIVAIGWPGIGNLSSISKREEVKTAVEGKHLYSAKALGQKVGVIYRFVCEINIGDYVLVPDGGFVHIGRIASDYKYDSSVDNDHEGYPHQRCVEWLYDKRAIPRKVLTGRLFDSLKGRKTLFSTHFDDINEIVTKKGHYFTQQTDVEIKKEYLKKLKSGGLNGVNSNSFENAVCILLSQFFPGLSRLSTTNSQVGDTDLYAELPGGVIVRVQVKHFYANSGPLGEWVVDQLANSMDIGENGIIVTSGTIDAKAEALAQRYTAEKNKNIGFINGQEFVDLLFQNLNQLSEEELLTFGLAKKVMLF